MTETERSLLDAVLENPDDDLPRLIYADWLDENGDAKRAEFIRAQITISQVNASNEYESPVFTSAVKSIIRFTPQDYNRWIYHDFAEWNGIDGPTTTNTMLDKV